MKKLLILLILTIMLIGAGGCCCCFPGEKPKKAKKQQTINVLPGICTFLQFHREYGTVISVQNIPNWANGQRQGVRFSNGKYFVFYLEHGTVITVKENSGVGPRVFEL